MVDHHQGTLRPGHNGGALPGPRHVDQHQHFQIHTKSAWIYSVCKYYKFIILIDYNDCYYNFIDYIVISERGQYSSTDDLSSLLESRFSETVVCVGNPDLREGASVIKVRGSAIERLENITSTYFVHLS